VLDKDDNKDWFPLTAERWGAPVNRNALVAAALGVRRHAGTETLTVASTVAGTCVCKAVHVEPGNIHLSTNKDTFQTFFDTKSHFLDPNFTTSAWSYTQNQ